MRLLNYGFFWNDKESGVHFMNCDQKNKTVLNSCNYSLWGRKSKTIRAGSLAYLKPYTSVGDDSIKR